MTDRDDLIGQSLMLQIQGPEATPEILTTVERIRPGGIILFAANIETPAGVYELVRQLQAKAADLGLPPLLIGIDQEGGNVSRLPAPFITVPSQMAQAATGDVETAHDCAVITGRQLQSVGINTNFAPVLDVNSNPANPVIGTRSFGEDPTLVTRFGLAAMRGYRETNTIATVKHFPGHGDTSVDSHVGLPVVNHDRKRLMAVEIAPFAAAIRAGVPAVMTAHIIFTALDDNPATLSRAILHDLLRGELGFDGVIFTDALDMGAIVDRYGAVDAVRLAKDAGADVLTAMGTPELQLAQRDTLRAAVVDGTLPADRFVDTARRLERLRATYGLTHELPPFVEPDALFADVALKLAQRSLTVLHGGESLPLAANTRLTLIDCLPLRWSPAEEASDPAKYLFGLLRHAFPEATGIAASATSLPDVELNAVQMARASEAVVLVTRNAAEDDYQSALGRALAATGVPLIHAAVRSPYAAAVPGAAVTLFTYGDPAVSLQSLVATLAGTADAGGQLPVTLIDAESGDAS